MIGLLARALAERAVDVARWESGLAIPVPDLRGVRGAPSEGLLSGSGDTVEFRIEVPGPHPTTYVVTVAEVRTR